MITSLAQAYSRAQGKRSVPTWHRLAAFSRRFASWTHRMQRYAEYGIPPQPENFDTNIFVYAQWPETLESYGIERGVFNRLAMKPGCRVLDLCCGYGWTPKHFYSVDAQSILAVDFDPAAIARARATNSAPNIEHRVVDIRTGIPDGPFDNVTWDAAIEHFTAAELAEILRAIKARLSGGGILSGYTIAEEPGGPGSMYHEIFFASRADLAALLHPHFTNVRVFETSAPSRPHNLYFWASDGAIPFGPSWDRSADPH